MDSLFECNLPPYLAHDLEAWKKGVEEHSRFLDCLWGELYGSINIAAISAFIDGVPFLSDLQRTFYKIYLTARYEALFAQQKNCKHP